MHIYIYNIYIYTCPSLSFFWGYTNCNLKLLQLYGFTISSQQTKARQNRIMSPWIKDLHHCNTTGTELQTDNNLNKNPQYFEKHNEIKSNFVSIPTSIQLKHLSHTGAPNQLISASPSSTPNHLLLTSATHLLPKPFLKHPKWRFSASMVPKESVASQIWGELHAQRGVAAGGGLWKFHLKKWGHRTWGKRGETQRLDGLGFFKKDHPKPNVSESFVSYLMYRLPEQRNNSLEVGYNIARMVSGGYKTYSKWYHVAHPFNWLWISTPIPAPASITNQSNNSNLGLVALLRVHTPVIKMGHQAEGSMRIMVMMVPSMPWKTHVDSGAMWKLTHAIPPCHDLDDFWWLMHGFISPPCLWEYLLAIYFNCNPIFFHVLHNKNRTSSNDAKINMNNQPRKSIL